uniref:Uncharacterized protein n=1 Tax=Cannabis sativa TaxID=3483 RepID=A0A803QCY5_CANSA
MSFKKKRKKKLFTSSSNPMPQVLHFMMFLLLFNNPIFPQASTTYFISGLSLGTSAVLDFQPENLAESCSGHETLAGTWLQPINFASFGPFLTLAKTPHGFLSLSRLYPLLGSLKNFVWHILGGDNWIDKDLLSLIFEHHRPAPSASSSSKGSLGGPSSAFEVKELAVEQPIAGKDEETSTGHDSDFDAEQAELVAGKSTARRHYKTCIVVLGNPLGSYHDAGRHMVTLGHPSKVRIDHVAEEAHEPWILEYGNQQRWISPLSSLSAKKLEEIKARGFVGGIRCDRPTRD